jgi:hypothetical protein
LENNSSHLKVRYSIETYEKLLLTVEETRKSVIKLNDDRLNGYPRDKVA